MRRLLFCMFLMTTALSATATQAAEISLQSIVQGDVVNVDVYITGVDDLIGFDFFVGFDPNAAAFRGVSAGSLLPASTSFVGYSPSEELIDETGQPYLVPIPDFSPVQILGTIVAPAPGVSGDGILATLLFQSLAGSVGTFSLTAGAFLNSAFETIPVTVATPPQPVPEPSTLALLGVGLAAMARKRLKRKTLS